MDDLDRWTRVLPLGTGAFGQVHLAWDTVAERWVAVKRFTGQDELGLLRFVIESRIRVEHPHLVRTLAFRLVDDRAWLVTELARGGSMRQLMHRSGPLPWGWVTEAVDQLLDALVALHATGVVHRDLKPANLLLRDAGAARPHLLVGDFGIATWRTVSMTGIGAAIGTPGYLAPEYLDGSEPAPATDLFAVGVLAAELLAGRRLVHQSNASPAIPSDWSTTLPLPDAVPAQLAAVLRRMADPDPRRRYADCAQAREALLSAAPPGRRGDLAAVEAPDLLSGLPSGWTLEGPLPPETPTTVTASAARAGVGAVAQEGGSAGEPGHSASAPATGSVDEPTSGQRAEAPSHSAGEPITALVTPPPPHPANEPVTGLVTQPQTHSATPPSGLTPPSGPTPPSGFTPPGGQTPPSGPTPPAGIATQPKTRRVKQKPAKKKRRGRRIVSVLVLLLLLGGAGTLWVASMTRVVPGLPIAGPGTRDPGSPDFVWVPAIVEPCSRASLSEERDGQDGRERCQRVSGGWEAWVKEPEDGFPISNPNGPFPDETCTADGDTDYTPVGEQVACTDGTWTVTS